MMMELGLNRLVRFQLIFKAKKNSAIGLRACYGLFGSWMDSGVVPSGFLKLSRSRTSTKAFYFLSVKAYC